MDGTFVVIGGDAAGMSAASKAKREDPDLDVVVFEKGDWVSYAACGLPYFIKGEVEALADLVAVTPEEFITERDIDVRLRHEVTAVHPETQTVSGEATGSAFEHEYENLLIATGAHAVEPPFESIDLDGIFTLHRMDDAAAIRDVLDPEVPTGTANADPSVESLPEFSGSAAAMPARIGIVGGGYVGIEMAEAFAAWDVEIHLFEMLPHVLDPFGAATAEVVEAHLRDHGVHVHLATSVTGFAGEERVEAVTTAEGMVPVDLVVIGVGVAPNTSLSEGTDIDLGPTGAIATDEYGQTTVTDVYAAGDCAEARHAVTGEPAYVPLALTANRAGRAIGSTISGTPTPVGETAGTAILKAFDLEVSRTGILDHEAAHDAGFTPVSTTITDYSRSNYYPGSEELTVTLTADGVSERVLGASIVGRDQAGKRIDSVATALHAGMTVSELEALDLAYAPPFGPVWDPVLTAARVLGGKLATT